MIHPSYTTFTNSAMMCSRRSVRFASGAHRPVIFLVTLMVITSTNMNVREIHSTLRKRYYTGIAADSF